MRTWKSLIPLVAVVAIAGCGSSSSSTPATKAGKTPPSGISTTGGTTSTPASSSTSTSTTSTSTAAADPAVEKLVPAALKSKGTLTVAADASYAPNEFFASDGHTVIGMDPDLLTAIGGLMGLKVDVVNATFDAIIPGLAAGKYDIGASSFTDTKAREATVDFVDYFVAGESFYTKASGGVSINTISDLCGHTVAVEKGTTEEADANTEGAKCKKAGKPGVTVLTFPDQNGANLALVSGKAQLGFADSPVAAYQVKKSSEQFKLVGQSYANAPYGLAIPKKSGLTAPVAAALKKLIADGSYSKILAKWGVQAGAIPASKVKINGAIS
jgi:polar amino acid transport system substrate-binding protein